MKNIRLISFDICPYVQRSVIVLLEKNVDFSVSYIDLANPPDWFLALSPLGKVPVLQIDSNVIFESTVINEYLDEIHPPSLLPSTPLQKAILRSWIAVADELLIHQYAYMIAKDSISLETAEHRIIAASTRIENALTDQDFFLSDSFSLVDAAFAPLFSRFDILNNIYGLEWGESHPKLSAWIQRLNRHKSVKQSLTENFEKKFQTYINQHSAYMRRS